MKYFDWDIVSSLERAKGLALRSGRPLPAKNHKNLVSLEYSATAHFGEQFQKCRKDL
jgi:hypothetical protein